MENQKDPIIEALQLAVRRLMRLVIVLSILIVLIPLFVLNLTAITDYLKSVGDEDLISQTVDSTALVTTETAETSMYWTPPSLNLITDDKLLDKVIYGKELIMHTAYYLGPKGTISQQTNGLNCQNCHLNAGTKVFGNNYGSVASTYPKLRARSGKMESIEKRVNDCFERSLNGKALSVNSPEMKSIVAYLKYIGKNVKKGEKAAGLGLKEITLLSRSADPEKGKIVYENQCASCHQTNGEGTKDEHGREFIYPALWGDASFNDAAGLYRISNMAKYVKYNMPFGISHENPTLSDEDSWDVAAYVVSMPRPHKNVPKDWPDKSKKPMDHPFGPYADNFSEKQHKYGPFQELAKK
jgi:thiosulfate dehydrogenase